MDYNTLLDLVTELGYRLSMSGAETFRVEDSINRILAAYGIQSEAYSIPNCLIVSIETPENKSITRMRRIGHHGNDLDAVERYNNLSRTICATVPNPDLAMQWLADTDSHLTQYSFPMILAGHFIGAFGFSFLFNATLADAICAGICGVWVGCVNRFLSKVKTNQFFQTMVAAFLASVPAYALGHWQIIHNPDAAIIGTLMLLVPGLLFVNAMRDIIYGDTNSGINRVIQVLLIAAAICLGTGVAWTLSTALWGEFPVVAATRYAIPVELLCCFIGCIGFSILFNIHGPGMLICIIGGVLTWGAYCLSEVLGRNDILASFWATVVAAAYSEIMARVRKYPAISYLVVAIFPLIPGAGVYYTMNYAVLGDMASFADKGIHTIAIAGIMAVGMLTVSTIVRLITLLRSKK